MHQHLEEHVFLGSQSCQSACGLEMLRETVMLKAGEERENVHEGLTFSFYLSRLLLIYLALLGTGLTQPRRCIAPCVSMPGLQSLPPREVGTSAQGPQELSNLLLSSKESGLAKAVL